MTVKLDAKLAKQDRLINSSKSGYFSVTNTPISIPREGEATSSDQVSFAGLRMPNRDTLEAIRDVEIGDVITCTDEEDFFIKLKS